MATFDIDTAFGTFEGTASSDVFNFYHSSFANYLHVYGYGGDDHFNFFADLPWDPEFFGGRSSAFYGGPGNDTFDGNGHKVSRLFGDAGNDVFIDLESGSGVFGGTGNDTYYLDPASPYGIYELAGEGTDTVILTGSGAYTKPANVENVVPYGGSPPPPPSSTTITGNSSANVLTGGSTADTISGLGGNDTLIGNDGNDKLYGGSGADSLQGGAGNDLLRGDGGRDQSWGGTGADTFVFNDNQFGAASAAGCEIIHDFSHAEGDRINLALVDANSSSLSDEAFTFIGAGAFAHAAGQLRYEQIDGNTYVQGDTDGDGVADFWLKLDGLQTLTSGDFFL